MVIAEVFLIGPFQPDPPEPMRLPYARVFPRGSGTFNSLEEAIDCAPEQFRANVWPSLSGQPFDPFPTLEELLAKVPDDLRS